MRLDRVYVSLGRAGRLTEAKLSAAATRRTACRGDRGAWAGAGSGDDDALKKVFTKLGFRSRDQGI